MKALLTIASTLFLAILYVIVAYIVAFLMNTTPELQMSILALSSIAVLQTQELFDD